MIPITSSIVYYLVYTPSPVETPFTCGGRRERERERAGRQPDGRIDQAKKQPKNWQERKSHGWTTPHDNIRNQKGPQNKSLCVSFTPVLLLFGPEIPCLPTHPSTHALLFSRTGVVLSLRGLYESTTSCKRLTTLGSTGRLPSFPRLRVRVVGRLGGLYDPAIRMSDWTGPCPRARVMRRPVRPMRR